MTHQQNDDFCTQKDNKGPKRSQCLDMIDRANYRLPCIIKIFWNWWWYFHSLCTYRLARLTWADRLSCRANRRCGGSTRWRRCALIHDRRSCLCRCWWSYDWDQLGNSGSNRQYRNLLTPRLLGSCSVAGWYGCRSVSRRFALLLGISKEELLKVRLLKDHR